MRESLWPAVLLALVAGFVDALGYLALGRLFTAHMSGNAAALGAYLGQADWSEVWRRGLPIPAFLAGGAAGATAVTLAQRRMPRRHLVPSFLLEIALLLGFVAVFPAHARSLSPGGLRFATLVWLLAAAMGIQAATLHRVDGERVNTTLISGMLIAAMEALVAWTFGEGDRARNARRVYLFVAIFSAFLVGAVAGSVGENHFGPKALLAPIAALSFVAADDLVARPKWPE